MLTVTNAPQATLEYKLVAFFKDKESYVILTDRCITLFQKGQITQFLNDGAEQQYYDVHKRSVYQYGTVVGKTETVEFAREVLNGFIKEIEFGNGL